MAVDLILTSGTPVNQLRAIAGYPQMPGTDNPAPYSLNRPIPVYDGMSGLATILDGKYKQGGVTTWERPGQ